MKNEYRLYEPTKIALERYFQRFGECYLEITAEGSISEKIKELLAKDSPLTLYLINIESFRPDLMGYFAKKYHKAYGPKELIVVEVKEEKPQIKDIFSQAKAYGEVFGAKHSLIVSPRPIPVEKHKILEERPFILSYASGNEIRICQLSVDNREILKDSWLFSPPF